MIVVEDLDNFMTALDSQFDDWTNMEETKEGKVEQFTDNNIKSSTLKQSENSIVEDFNTENFEEEEEEDLDLTDALEDEEIIELEDRNLISIPKVIFNEPDEVREVYLGNNMLRTLPTQFSKFTFEC